MQFIEDSEILWLAVEKVGSPPVWAPNAVYQLGDLVVPVNPQPGQENLAFQCVGFLGQSGGSQPAFTTGIGDSILDNQIEWRAVDPNADPLRLKYDQYYLINETVTVTT